MRLRRCSYSIPHPSLPAMDDAAEGLRMTSFSDWFKGYAGACSLGWLDVWCDSRFWLLGAVFVR